MENQQFCLRWNNHQSNLLDMFGTLLAHESLVDVTLACDGTSLKAHKVVLSACSPFFQDIFLNNPCKHPIVILKDMTYEDLKAVVDFMYHGEINIAQEQLPSLLKCAESLKIKGLAEMSAENHLQMKMRADQKLNRNTSKLSNALNKNSSNSPISRKRQRPNKSFGITPLPNPVNQINHEEKDKNIDAMKDSMTPSEIFQCELDEDLDESVNNEDNFELTEQEKQSLDLLTVDDSQLIMPKIEKEDPEPYDDEYLDVGPEHYENQFDNGFNETGSTSLLNSIDGSDTNQNVMDKKSGKPVKKQVDGSQRRKRRLWTDSEMESAVGAVIHGGWTTYAASSRFGIPRRTLRYYIEKVKASL